MMMVMATAGKMILPFGTRFKPSDEVLVNYLKRKLDGVEEKHCLIPELDVYKYSPWDLITEFSKLSVLPSDGRKAFCFYHPGSPNGKRNSQKTPHGSWSSTGNGRKPRQSDPVKWSKTYLRWKTSPNGASRASPTGYAMHKYMIMSNPSIVLCKIKRKPIKGKKSADLVSCEADMIGSHRATASSDNQFQLQDTTPEASMIMPVECQDTTPPSAVNVAEYSISSPHQPPMMVAVESLSEDVYTDGNDFIQLEDIPLRSPILMEELPCLENTFTHGHDQVDFAWLYPQEDVTPDQGGSIGIFHHNLTSQLPDDVVPGSISPPQQPQAMHTEEIFPIIGHTSFTGSGRDMMHPLMNSSGLHGTDTMEAPRSASNSQTLIPSQNHVELSLELLKMVREWSRNYNIFPSSDSFEGGITNTSYFGQSCESQQTNLEATPDFAAEQTVETEFSELETLLESFFADSPAPVSVTDSLTGGYSTEYRGVPYASVDGTFDATNPSMSKGY